MFLANARLKSNGWQKKLSTTKKKKTIAKYQNLKQYEQNLLFLQTLMKATLMSGWHLIFELTGRSLFDSPGERAISVCSKYR